MATSRRTNKDNIEVINFSINKLPALWESTETSSDKHVWYGVDNLYPNFILHLYDNSPTHQSIVDDKVMFILGDGLRYKNGQGLNIKVNPEDSLLEFSSKLVADYVLFNFFAVEVVYNLLGKPFEYYHVPAHQLRTNKEKTKFWVSEDWSAMKKPVVFERFNGYSKDTKSKIFYFDGYKPSISKVYPKYEYHSCIKAIQTEIEAISFHLNQIQNQFSPATIITMYQGSNPSDELKKTVNKQLSNSYTGSEGKKWIVNYQDAMTGKAPEVENIGSNDWDKAYELGEQSSKERILRGHGAPAILFHDKTEGQLGGATELETQYEIFKGKYIRVKRNELESAFKLLFMNSEIITDAVEFIDRPLFGEQVPDEVKKSVLTINEWREIMGKPSIADGDRLIGDKAQPQVQPVQQSKFGTDYTYLKEEDFDRIKHLGITAEEFEFLEEGETITSVEDFSRAELKFEQTQEIADYLISNEIKGKTIAELKTDLRKDLGINITLRDLQDTLKKLNDAGVVNIAINDDKVYVSPIAEDAPKRKIEVMYQYKVRSGYGAEIIDNTRAFCKKLIDNNRLYTREEIQTMSSIFGYDVFRYGGGWYRSPDSGEATKHCRHEFVSKTVARRVV